MSAAEKSWGVLCFASTESEVEVEEADDDDFDFDEDIYDDEADVEK